MTPDADLTDRTITFQELKVLANAGLDQAFRQHLGRSPSFAERREWWTARRLGMDPYYLAAFEEEHREMIVRAAVGWKPKPDGSM